MSEKRSNPFGARSTLQFAEGEATIYRLGRIEDAGLGSIARLPYSIRILLENLLRHCDGRIVREEDVAALAAWEPKPQKARELSFMPSRVIMQDFTGVPAVVDLAAMRSAITRLGGDPERINPLIPVDLVIDHSVQVDVFGQASAFFENVEREYERNRERYALLRWAQKAFRNFRVVPPGTGIVHQVNLEYLAEVVHLREEDGELAAFPDTLVGTDSHTTMINGLGVLGWGVGGIEAEAVMLGQPYAMLMPEVVGFRLTGELPEGATATDLVLRITEILRKHGVVGKFVEFHGPGMARLALADRATIANMAPEYGATMGFFPVDEETLNYLRQTGRDDRLIQRVERYCKEQGLFHSPSDPEPDYSDSLELDMGTVEPSLSGPRRPQDRVSLHEAKSSFLKVLDESYGRAAPPAPAHAGPGPAEGGAVATLTRQDEVTDGAVVIAAITSCTNTSNPSVMVGAGLLAKKAVEKGLSVKPWVKTSLAPGSRVVSQYLADAGLMPYLEQLNFHVVGYGCTTCIGNSGLLIPDVAKAVAERDLVVGAVLSGNRNFEGRINPLVKANYLASPPLVIAYALAGRLDVDLTSEPLGRDPDGNPVYLADIWPSQAEIRDTIHRCLRPEIFRSQYARVFEGDEMWRSLPVPDSASFEWDPDSTYIQEPPFFTHLTMEAEGAADIEDAAVLVRVGDSVTTDHISPAGAIPRNMPAGVFLQSRGVETRDFNSFGSRRGNHEVMVRGTFGNIRLKNQLVPGIEGGWTTYLGAPEVPVSPTTQVFTEAVAGAGAADGGKNGAGGSGAGDAIAGEDAGNAVQRGPSPLGRGEKMTIYDASVRYQRAGTPLIVLAGKEYGTGSSRDWAAKGTFLLGVRAVLAESYERIHRSNLIGMGVLPLQFMPGENADSHGLDGTELYTITGISGNGGNGSDAAAPDALTPGKRLRVSARKTGADGRPTGEVVAFDVICRLDSPVEIDYFRNGGILQYVLRKLAG